MLALRPTGLPEAYGHLWPDDVPTEFLCPPDFEMEVSRYTDPKTGPFGIAYTHQQIEEQVRSQGFFRPYIPVLLTKPVVIERKGKAVLKYEIPFEGIDGLLKGCEMDLVKTRYATMEEVDSYCYLVAACTGKMCLPIFGATGDRAVEYGRLLGMALQYTNILRDVREDFTQFGRVYLPDALQRDWNVTDFGLLAANRDIGPLRGILKAWAGLTEARYQATEKAWRLMTRADRWRLRPARFMQLVYGALLRKIVRRGCDVLSSRVRHDKTYVLAAFLRAAVAF